MVMKFELRVRENSGTWIRESSLEWKNKDNKGGKFIQVWRLMEHLSTDSN